MSFQVVQTQTTADFLSHAYVHEKLIMVWKIIPHFFTNVFLNNYMQNEDSSGSKFSSNNYRN